MAQVSWTKPLVLAAALLVLGSAAYWLEYSHKPEQEEKEEQAKKLFNLKGTPIKSIRLVDGEKSFEFQCMDIESKLCKPGDNSKWELTTPLKARADDSNVNSLLSTLNNVQSTDTITLTGDSPQKREELMKQYKLDLDSRKSAPRVEVINGEGNTTIAYLGERHPINDGIFAFVESAQDKVLVLPSYFKTNLEKNLTYWRDKKLFSLTAPQVESFELQGSSGKITGEKKDGQWMVNGKLPGDIENIDSFLTAATYLTAKEFVANSKSEPAAAKALQGTRSALTLRLNPKEKDSVTLELKEKGKTLYASVSNLDPLFELEFSVKDRLDKSVKDLRLVKLITSMERFNTRKMEFSGKPLGDDPLVLEQKDSKWMLAEGNEADHDRVQTLLDKLSGNRIQEFQAKIPAGESAGVRLAMMDDKGEKKRDLLFWKAGGKLYARDLTSSRKEALVVDSAIQDALPWERGHFVKKAASPSPSPQSSDAGAGDGNDDHGHEHEGHSH